MMRLPLREMNRNLRRAVTCLLAFVLLLGSWSWPAPKVEASGGIYQEWHTAPNGDGNSCTMLSPCSLETARDQIRLETASMSGDIIIWLHDGRYELSQTFTLTAADSGLNGFDVAYRAYPGATPVLSGGIEIGGWTEHGGGIWKAYVPGDSEVRQLYVDGQRAVRARTEIQPSGYTVNSGGFLKPADDLIGVPRLDQVEAVLFSHWRANRCLIDQVDGLQVYLKQPCWTNTNLHRFQPAALTWLENAMVFLDEPGEFYFNPDTRELYYMPRAGEVPNEAETIVPVLETIVSGQGSAASPIGHIRFEGVTFSHNTWLDLQSDDGYASVQAGFRIVGEGHQSYGDTVFNSWVKMGEGVVFEYGQQLHLEGNTFTAIGSSALGLGRGTQDTTVVGNHFHRVSGSAIQLGGIHEEDYHPSLPASQVRDNRISNNYIHHIGEEYLDTAAIWVGYAKDTDISHNKFHDLPYSAISVGWGWGSGLVDQTGNPAFSGDNRIAYNDIHDIMQVLYDGGAVYTLGNQPGTVIEGNHIRRQVNEYGAIYLDMGAGNHIVRNNVAYDNMRNFIVKGYDHEITYNYWDEDELHMHLYDEGTESLYEDNSVVVDGLFPMDVLVQAGLEPAYAHLLPRSASHNVAVNAEVKALHAGLYEGYPDLQPEAAVDQRGDTAAAAAGPWTLQLVLDRHYDLSAMVLRFTEDIPDEYEVATTADGVNWSHLVLDASADSEQLVALDGSAKALRITSLGGAMGIREVELYPEHTAVPVILGEYLAVQHEANETVMVTGDTYMAATGELLQGIDVGTTVLAINGQDVSFEVTRYAQLAYEWEHEELAVGRSMATRLWGITADGMRAPLENVLFTSSDPAIAAINSTGTAFGLAVGESDLTASAAIYLNETVAVTQPLLVYEEQLDIVEVSAPSYMRYGESVNVEVSAYYNSGYPVDLQEADIVFSSGHPNVAAVDQNGVVTAGQAGLAAIQAAVTLGQTTKYGETDISVYPEDWDVELVGSASGSALLDNDGVWSITASGANIWNTADEFLYVYTNVDMDNYPLGVSIIATVESISDHVSASTMSGLMLRDNVAPGSMNVNYRIHGSSGAANKNVPLTKRLQANASTTHVDTQKLPLPATIRLTYHNNIAHAHYWDEAAQAWELAGRVTDFPLTDSFTIGIAHASHNSKLTTETAFNDVEIRSAEDIYPQLLLPLTAELDEAVLEVGGSTQLTVRHADDSEIVTYSSLHPSVASVSSTGEVDALAVGRATIVVTAISPTAAWEPRQTRVTVAVYDPDDVRPLMLVTEQLPAYALRTDGVTSLGTHASGPVEHGNDGNTATYAQATGSYAWMYAVDMEDDYLIRDVEVTFAAHGWATEYELLGSIDGQQWSVLLQRTDGASGQSPLFTLNEPRMLRYVAVRAIKPDGASQPGVQMAVAELRAWAVDLSEPRPEPPKLDQLVTSPGGLQPVFHPDVEAYTLVVPTAATSVQLTPDASAPIIVTAGSQPVTVTGGVYEVQLHGSVSGSTTITITVGESGSSRDYTIVVTKLAPLELTIDTAVIQPGQSAQLTVLHADSSETISFASLQPGIAGVHASGEVDGLAAGLASLVATATHPQGLWAPRQARVTVAVYDPEADYSLNLVTLQQPSRALRIDGSTTLNTHASAPADKGNDGNPATFAQATGSYAWMYAIDLEEDRLIGDIEITFASHGWATEYELLGSPDGQQWSVLLQRSDGASGQSARFTLAVPQLLQHVAVRAVKPNGAGQPGVQMAVAELSAWALEPSQTPINAALDQPAQALTIDGVTTLNTHASAPVGRGNDGNPSTFAQATGSYAWMYAIDMEQLYAIRHVELIFAAHGWATEYELLGSTDGQQWSVLLQRTDGASAQRTRFLFEVPQLVRHIAVRAVKPDGAGQPGIQMAVAELSAWGYELVAL